MISLPLHQRHRPPLRQRLLKQLFWGSLGSGLLLQLVTPVALADGTSAGLTINNQATATFSDPDDPNTLLEIDSNIIQVLVAEVAGITVTTAGTVQTGDVNNDSLVGVGDTFYALFTVSNVGNDPTQFRIPNQATVQGPGSSNGNLEISLDGITWQPITGADILSPSRQPGESLLVRVPVQVTSNSTTPLTIQLGETPNGDQNQPRSNGPGDVYTEDNGDPSANPGGAIANEVDGAPVNGVREASAVQSITLGQQLTPYPLATLLKVQSRRTTNGTNTVDSDIQDDTIGYDLEFQVEASNPAIAVVPAPLLGDSLNGVSGDPILSGGANRFILVSDAIPAGTFLASAAAPANWDVVYTTDPVSIDANAATWTSTQPPLNTVTRVGFVYNTTSRGAIAIGTTVSGFQLDLAIDGSTNPQGPLTIYNLAQLFGRSPQGAPVHDESGDDSPSNFGGVGLPGQLPPGSQDSNGDNVPDAGTSIDPEDGYLDPQDANDLANTGLDSSNSNSGQDDANSPQGGEANPYVLDIPRTSNLLNGPQNSPNAVGPTGSADDFSNQVISPSAAPGGGSDPAPVTFNNTIENTGNLSGTLTLAPSTLLSNGQPTDLSNLPSGTTVILTVPPGGSGGGNLSATYLWNGSSFVFQPGGVGTPTGNSPIAIANLSPGATVTYTTTIDLPSGTTLLTQNTGGLGVPILAGLDTNGQTGSEATNTTINRIYQGYLTFVKESRILQGDGPPPDPADTEFSATAQRPAPGNIIEYRISYRNVSEVGGAGNIGLQARNITLTENGLTQPNNWAIDNDSDGLVDTQHVLSSAQDSRGGAIAFFNNSPPTLLPAEPAAADNAQTNITQYVMTLPAPLGPQESGEFVFQRQLN